MVSIVLRGARRSNERLSAGSVSERAVPLKNEATRFSHAEIGMFDSCLYTKADEAAELLAALANKKRLLIMCHLYSGEMSVGTLAQKVALSQSALSQHLAKLRILELVSTRRAGQTIYYSLRSDEVRRLLTTLDDIYTAAAMPTAHAVPAA